MWDPATATGLGPFPGVDPLEAVRVVFSELPDLPFLPELPARGVGSDAVGRTAGLLAGLHVEVGTGTWRFVPHPGRDEHRARTALTTDLDALEEAADGYEGLIKVRIVGPWSLVGSIELPKGEKALADEGAVRDVAASLAEGLRLHLNDLHRRLPGLTGVVVQVDEPLLASILAGEMPTASGWGRLRTYERNLVEDALRQVLGAAGGRLSPGPVERRERDERRDGDEDQGTEDDAPGDTAGVWIGATRLDGALLRAAGARFIGLDGAALDTVDEDEIGEAIDAGVGLLVACVPLEGRPKAQGRDGRNEPPHGGVVAPVRSLWKRLGFLPDLLPRAVAVTPVEGLEQLDRSAVPAVLRRAVEAARYLEESAAEESS
ncbi:MAG TPA: methionine synthase [Acidimicrobiia bacterium]|nr:methionine synthase [Acidimicrobiia bacterium]